MDSDLQAIQQIINKYCSTIIDQLFFLYDFILFHLIIRKVRL